MLQDLLAELSLREKTTSSNVTLNNQEKEQLGTFSLEDSEDLLGVVGLLVPDAIG